MFAKKTILLLFTAIVLFTSKIHAQKYTGAVGARFGYGIGLTGVYMFNPSGGHGLEFLARYGYHGLILNKPGANIQVLYEKHWEIGRRGNWTVYAGAGPAIGFGKLSSGAKDKFFALGISPIGGVDFTTQNLRIPLVLAFDYKPTLYGDIPVGENSYKSKVSFSYYEIAFSVRVAIK